MPSRPSKRKDFSQIARMVVDAATSEGAGPQPRNAPPPPDQDTRNRAAVALGKLGASKGG